ncbi:hypothetical protein JZ751_016186 [Albula glossodonta]|uniref:Uncharacterized protein n=1 Tax=Albula glossodonta TaxID=121402 RepID=A0A8T2MWK7_9TELE|nr:hypothetical protein JZ751_016186 [Albula glossodonta]
MAHMGLLEPDYAEPELRQAGHKLGSTFRPPADEGYTVPLILNHYDVPGKLPEYAEPLPPEPEYATPFCDQPPDPPLSLLRPTCPAQGPRPVLSAAQYDCPGHKTAPNGYCTPAPHAGAPPRKDSVVYAEPQPAVSLPLHTYHEPL